MSIASVQSLPAGCALRVFLSQHPGARYWRLLRKVTGVFSGPDDPEAVVVLPDGIDTVVTDASFLINGQTYFYRLYSMTPAGWVASDVVSGVPAFSALDVSVDPMVIVRDRLSEGLQAMVAAGKLGSANGRIAVLTAPPVFEDTFWPVVTIHLSTDPSSERGIGDLAGNDRISAHGDKVTAYDGWFSNVQLSIISWSLNPDERILLRQAIKFLVVANLGVFDELGVQQVEISQDDVEDFTSYNVPVYQSVTTFRCLSLTAVALEHVAISDVETAFTPTPQQVRGFGKPYPPINKQAL